MDSDQDGLIDSDERKYCTDPYNKDTDGDGIGDWKEIRFGYSPHNAKKVKFKISDTDGDGLIDKEECRLGTKIFKQDSDGDGYNDGYELKNAYDPLATSSKKMLKKIKIDLKKQELSYFSGKYKLKTFLVSTGKRTMPTPKGKFEIANKSPKAWSKTYGLWMPYWMGIKGQRFGLHELPVWPNGYREGADHLGKPVSHGCIRLGISSAKELYDWTDIKTVVEIY